MATKKPFKKLQSARDMPAKVKVGSWLEKNDGVNGDEAYDSSDSESSSAENGGPVNDKDNVAPQEISEDEDEDEMESSESAVKRESNIDWEVVLPRMRSALEDPSSKRRSQYIQRYLYVDAESPPTTAVPAIVQTSLQLLPLISSPEHADDIVGILIKLVERDIGIKDSPLKLRDKLVKYVTTEVDKVIATARSIPMSSYLPYLILVIALINNLLSTIAEKEITANSQYQNLIIALAYLLDVIDQGNAKGKDTPKMERTRKRAKIRISGCLRKQRNILPAILSFLATQSVPQPHRLSSFLGQIVALLQKVRQDIYGQEGCKTDGKGVIVTEKDSLINYYATHILGSKTAIPRNASLAFQPILSILVNLQLLSDKLIPAAERMLLRSPEIALELTSDLLNSLDFDISPLLPSKLVTPTINASKSSNPDTRAKSLPLMKAVCRLCQDETILNKIAVDILTTPKAGKTASPENRAILFSMCGFIPPSDPVSTTVIETLAPLIAKEGNEPALASLCASITPHLEHLLRTGTPISPTISTVIAKELSSGKVGTRRLLSDAVGEALWTISGGQEYQWSEDSVKFLSTIVPSFESNLASASNNTPSNPIGYLDGLVTAAIAVGPIRNVESSSNLSAGAEALLSITPKPTFLLNDKAYSKLPAGMDEKWFLRALLASIRASGKKKLGEPLRSAIGLAYLHCLMNAKDGDVRTQALQQLPTLAQEYPKAIHSIVRDGVTAWLINHDASTFSHKVTADEPETSGSHHTRKIGQLLYRLFSPGKATSNKSSLEDLAVDVLVVAHHHLLMEGAQISWINLVQGAGIDPAKLAVDRRESILMKVWDNAAAAPKNAGFAQAALRAITTLAFVCPAIYVPIFMDQITTDLHPSNIAFIGIEERGIWITPADQTYVDVLNTKKSVDENKNRKEYADEKWEAEVRESLAQKRAASGTKKLTKVEQAAVNAQLAKESEIRSRIASIQAKMTRALDIISALIASRSEMVEKKVEMFAQLLLDSPFGPGSFLMDSKAFEVFISLSTVLTDRLGAYRRLLAAAILRGFDAPFVSGDYLEEGVEELVTRLLHQVQFIADQTPYDATTYGLLSILLSKVIKDGGVGTENTQSEAAQEQLTLVVNIISACCGEFGNEDYPRLNTIASLLDIIGRYPRLAKDASSALVDLGAALQDNAKPEEVKELISGTLSKDSNVRNAALQALQPVDLTEMDYSQELWIALHDDDEQNANLASHLWEDNGLDIPESYLPTLIPFLAHGSEAVRISTARALKVAAEQYPSQIKPTLQGLESLYKEKAKLLVPEYDRFGMVILETVDRPDPWEARVAISLAYQNFSSLLDDSLVETIFDFMFGSEALGDRNSTVRRAMLDAAIAIIDEHGGKSVASLMRTFEEYLARDTPSTDTSDNIKEATVILFGRLAGHLEPSDERIPKVVDRLVEALNTPSESVQAAVADCLPALVSGMGDEVEYLVDKMFSTLTTGAKYAGRRGAAYGLAGVVKGRGLISLKEYELMDKLKEAAEDKGAYQSRQGAVFAFETLSATLGRTFEPYIITVVPILLALFGDGNTDVREATQDASKVIMSKISGHCVKLMLPDLLEALEEKQWRTKKGAIELLGSMAFCAPRQLSLSLPTIIPQLTGVINDSHAQVKSAANTSLKRFGEVLNNPEVKALQSTLMKALADPTAKTAAALTALLKTTFEHYLDAPSLALVMPIIDRGLRQRSSETKRKSVQIVGNMASLTEARDLVPYLNELMPLIHEVLVDPVPEARATAAKSLGTLVERLGENNFPELVAQLLQTLKSDTSGVDRQGAAQGLSEILSALGLERLESMMPDIISSTSSPRPYVREGFISLLVYLPATFGHRFAPQLGRVIPPILNGLADDSEYVREASMRAGKMIISSYSTKAIDLLLPELEKGMLDPAWRIRQSSIALTGELLYKVTGISGKVELEEDDAAHSADNARKALLESLGQDRRDRVLATLYIVRQDSIGIVRQASIHIWKALVQNTPRTTREILPVLMQVLMSLLGSDESEQQETASRTLGELCRKNGERIYGDIIPILQRAISSTDPRSREGACLAFADVMAAANKDILSDYEDAIISAIRKALVDRETSVRAAAAQTFDTAQHFMGAKAVDQTIPTLLEAMRNPGEASETALQALKEVMSVRANSVFPVLIPTLTAQPISAFNARALGALVKVAGSALNKRLDSVLGALVQSLEKEKSDEVKSEVQAAIEALLVTIIDPDGVHQLEMLLIGWARSHDAVRRATAARVFGTLCQVSQADLSDYRVDWIRILVNMFDDPVSEVIDAAWESLDHFVKTVDKDELEDLVVPLRRTIESIGSPGKTVPGFSRPKGVQSIVPILLAGVLSGTQEQREQAALGVGDLVQRTTEAAIKPYIIQLTGPLIRVISGQGLAPQIKTAILSTLTVLLEKVPQLVRPFHPQLTRTFVKSATDPAALSVRNKAAVGLGELMKHQPRVDPLITELVGLIRSSEKDIAPSVVQALAAVCASAGKNVGAAAKSSIIELVEEGFAEPKGETYSTAIAKVVSGLAQSDAESIKGVVETFLTAPMPPTSIVSLTIHSLMEDASDSLYQLDVVEEIIDKVKASISADSSSISRPAREARDLMKESERWKDDSRVQAVFK